MDSALLENQTRKKILLMLKRKGDMSVDDLSREVNITPMGVRQHLLVLERNGVVEYATKKHGVGRPGFLYRLTAMADDLFPKAYQGFAMDILMTIEDSDGMEKIDEIFRRRKDRILAERTEMLSGKDDLYDRLSALAEILQRDGCMAELEENGRYYSFKQFNCPISKIASRYREACKYDLQLFKELIGEDVVRQQCLSDGAQACVYVIPKNNNK
ncbi:MAG: ArsR family transcriptional regulator [Thermodesulfovibrionales bacterium]